jgi:UPF0716 protein FxsA
VTLILVLAILIAVPFLEIEVFLAVAHAIGGWNALGLLILVSFVGIWLVRHEGFVLLGRIRQQLDRGQMPGDQLIDGGLLLLAGLLMIIPGFVTDGIALLLIFPPTRALARGALKRRFRTRVQVYGIVPRRAADRLRGPYDGPDDVIDV